MTLLDDVARAMANAEGDFGDWEYMDGDTKEMLINDARAAIAVFARWLREPSAALLGKLAEASWDVAVFKAVEERRQATANEVLHALAEHLEKENV